MSEICLATLALLEVKRIRMSAAALSPAISDRYTFQSLMPPLQDIESV